MTTYERTKNFSDKRGYSLQDTAIKAGLSKNAIYRWKSTTPSDVSIKAVADVLGVSFDYLKGNTDSTMPKQSTNEPLDVVDIPDSRRDALISANGQPINDDDWAIIKAVLAKYQNKSEG
ncbi:helix-turn-helix domain-containing protein [Weissella tructae]|uniref:helix-turn-helix domain-containing protein n=1 Tax=Weissella tructae TaxID=887702 RepID=UPI003D94C236